LLSSPRSDGPHECQAGPPSDIPRMPGGCEVMIIPSGIRGKVGLLDGATEGGRNRQLIVPRH
jgi:hypothetical protein